MTKACVYIWPLMSKPAQRETEVAIVEAGYTNKKQIEVGEHRIWRCT